MPFQPGQSGNPGGRPKELTEIQQLARRHAPDAIETLSGIMRDQSAPPPARVAAAVHLLDRGFGKPAQAVTGEGGGAIVVQIATGIDRDPTPSPPSFLRDDPCDQASLGAGPETPATS